MADMFLRENNKKSPQERNKVSSIFELILVIEEILFAHQNSLIGSELIKDPINGMIAPNPITSNIDINDRHMKITGILFLFSAGT